MVYFCPILLVGAFSYIVGGQVCRNVSRVETWANQRGLQMTGLGGTRYLWRYLWGLLLVLHCYLLSCPLPNLASCQRPFWCVMRQVEGLASAQYHTCSVALSPSFATSQLHTPPAFMDVTGSLMIIAMPTRSSQDRPLHQDKVGKVAWEMSMVVGLAFVPEYNWLGTI